MTSFALYEAYGTRLYEWSDGVTGDPDRQKANTKEEESDLNLLNEGMRFRDLETGTFLTRDPIGYGDGPNVYCYVHCNPVMNFDPFGLKEIEDYEDDKEEAQEKHDEALEDLEEEWEDKDKNSDYARDLHNIGKTLADKLNKANKAIDKIEATAASMNQLTGGNIDPRKLNDEWKTYKDYRASDGFMNFTGTKDFADKATDGDIKGAAKELAILEAKAIIGTMVGSKAFQMMKGPATSVVPKSGLGNSFKGKTPKQIDNMFKKKGFGPRGPDPVNGKGGYVNPKTGRSYHIDEANSFGEAPHVDVNRLRDYKGSLDKNKYDM